MILVVGSYGTGITVRLPRVPEAGETIGGAELAIGFGGKSSNQAVAAKRQGATEVSLITAVGNDAFGMEAKALWEDEGVGAEFVKTVDNVSTMAGAILVEPSGENRIAIAPGALNHLVQEDLDKAIELFDRCSLLVVCLEIDVEVVSHAIKLAKERGVKVVLNPAPAASLASEVIALADFFVPNESEYAFYQESGYERAPGQALIVTRGSKGAQLVTDEGEQFFEPLIQEKVVDTTGAGDTFVGTFAAAIDNGHTVDDSIRRAIVASSMSVAVEEVIPSIPTLEDVDRALEASANGVRS